MSPIGAQLPDHRPSQTLTLDVVSFGADRLGVVVGDELPVVGVVEKGNCRRSIPAPHIAVLIDVVCFEIRELNYPRNPGSWRRAFALLILATVVARAARPAATVGNNSHQHL